MPTIQLMASQVPSAVATPLPPLNFSQTGKRWPSEGGAAGDDGEVGGEPRGDQARRRRPCRHRAAGWPAPAACCRCAAHWWRRYCRSRCCGCRRGPPCRGQQQAEGDRAQQIAEHRRRDHGPDRQIGDDRIHHACPSAAKTWRPSTKVLQHRALHRAAVIGRVLRLASGSRRRRCGAACSRSISTMSAGAPLARRPCGRPRISAGRLVRHFSRFEQRERAVVVKLEADRQQRLQPDRCRPPPARRARACSPRHGANGRWRCSR